MDTIVMAGFCTECKTFTRVTVELPLPGLVALGVCASCAASEVPDNVIPIDGQHRRHSFPRSIPPTHEGR